MILAQDVSGRVLLQLRDGWPHVPGAGRWSLFGGGVEVNESPGQAALREFEEETGIGLEPSDLQPLAKVGSTTKAGGVLFAFELTEPVSPARIRLGEGAGFAFLDPSQLASYPLMPSTEVILRHAGYLPK